MTAADRSNRNAFIVTNSGSPGPTPIPYRTPNFISDQFCREKLRYRHQRTPDMMPSEALGAADCDPGQLTATPRIPIEHDPLACDADDIGDEPAAGPQRRPCRVQQILITDAAADKDGVGRWQTGERLGGPT